MFIKSAPYYDKIYSWKDYRKETQLLIAIIRKNPRSPSNRLLDVACGTGHHLLYLREHFAVEGIDISSELLEIARTQNSEVPFHLADMIDFDLNRRFDVVTCLFSSIGYVKTLENLSRAINAMARHVMPGGLLIIEPWFTPGNWHPGKVHATFIDEPDLKIARISTSFVDGRLSYFDLHYLIGTPQGTEHFVERHEMGLFETEEIHRILSDAGFVVTYDPEGLTGRGLFIGQRAPA